jgi:hypothetical protein
MMKNLSREVAKLLDEAAEEILGGAFGFGLKRSIAQSHGSAFTVVLFTSYIFRT